MKSPADGLQCVGTMAQTRPLSDSDHSSTDSSFPLENTKTGGRQNDDYPVGARVRCTRGLYKNQRGTVTLSRGKLVRIAFDEVGKRCVLQSAVVLLLPSDEGLSILDNLVELNEEARTMENPVSCRRPLKINISRYEPRHINSDVTQNNVIHSPKFDVDLGDGLKAAPLDEVDENKWPNEEETNRLNQNFHRRLTTESDEQKVDPIYFGSPRAAQNGWVSFDIPFEKSVASLWMKPKKKSPEPLATRVSENNRGMEKVTESFESLERVGTFGGGKNDRIQVVSLDRSASHAMNSYRNTSSAATLPRTHLGRLSIVLNDSGQKNVLEDAGIDNNTSVDIPTQQHAVRVSAPTKPSATRPLRIGSRICCATGKHNGRPGEVVAKDGKMLVVQLEGVHGKRYFRQEALIPLSTKAEF